MSRAKKPGMWMVLAAFTFLICPISIYAQTRECQSTQETGPGISGYWDSAFAGDEYGILHVTDGIVYLSRISLDGTIQGQYEITPVKSVYNDLNLFYKIIWIGDKYRIFWYYAAVSDPDFINKRGIYTRSVTKSGTVSSATKIMGSVSFSCTENSPKEWCFNVVRNNDGYAIVFIPIVTGDAIKFAIFNQANSQVGTTTILASTTDPLGTISYFHPQLEWSGSQYGIVFSQVGPGNYLWTNFIKADSSGNVIATSSPFYTSANFLPYYRPNLFWNDINFVVTRSQGTTSTGTNLKAKDETSAESTLYTTVSQATISYIHDWTGDYLGMIYYDNKLLKTYFSEYDNSYSKITNLEISSTKAYRRIDWDGSYYRVLSSDTNGMYFEKISCSSCIDADSDGLSETPTGCGTVDQCPGTASGAVVDSNGCSCAQKTCPVNQQCNPATAVCACSNPCSSGQRQCSGNSYQDCVQDVNGCWYWGSAVACTSPTPTCYNGVCVSCTLDSECVTPPDDPICYLPGTCTAGSCLYTKKAEGTSCGTNKQCDASGMCVCSAGYTVCPDGNCYNFQTDPNNCGSCGYTCSFANAVATCSAGICVMGACNAGYYDIDNDPIDGCEYACTSSGAEICNDLIDNDCDTFTDCADSDCSSDPACACTITDAFWSDEIVSDRTYVTLTAAGKNCDGKTVTFDIWEDDFLPFEDFTDDDAIEDLGLTAGFAGNIAQVAWQALYITHKPDGKRTETGKPEYYFKAKLADGTYLKSGNLDVTGNLPPTAPAEFLIKPNGREVYDQSANITWNPAYDPDDDPLEYKIEYSADSGASWNAIKEFNEHYGYISKAEYDGEEKESIVLDFG